MSDFFKVVDLSKKTVDQNSLTYEIEKSFTEKKELNLSKEQCEIIFKNNSQFIKDFKKNHSLKLNNYLDSIILLHKDNLKIQELAAQEEKELQKNTLSEKINIDNIVFILSKNEENFTELERSIFSYCEKFNFEFSNFFEIAIRFYMYALLKKETVFEKTRFSYTELIKYDSRKKTVIRCILNSLEQKILEKVCIENYITPYEFVNEAMNYALNEIISRNIDIKKLY